MPGSVPRRPSSLAALALLALLAAPSLAATVEPIVVPAPDEGRLLRMPDLHGDRIVFVYAGDLWTVARTGGTAVRLTSDEGYEVMPRFSPDGTRIAFTGEYDGNPDVFTIPAGGGVPTRLTFHSAFDQMVEWTPDGDSILFRSPRSYSPRYDRFFVVPARGGFEQPLPLSSAGHASWSADGRLLAFVSPTFDRRNWKRYRGGNAPNVWLYDVAARTSRNLTAEHPGPDEWPMFHERTLYYASDRGGRTVNLWALDLDRGTHRQVTRFETFDVKSPAIGPDGIVFENGGWLWRIDLPTEKLARVPVVLPADLPGARAEFRDVSRWMGGLDLAPNLKRAVVEARGDLFIVPTGEGEPRNLTQSSGVRERDPAWSPDGRWIAFWSDASGEYQLMLADPEGRSAPRAVTKEPGTYRYPPVWSPDARKLAWSDKTGRLWALTLATGKVTLVAKDDGDDILDYEWSPDSRWIVFARQTPALMRTVHLWSYDTGRLERVGDGMSDDFSPSFDPAGRYLYFISLRRMRPDPGVFEQHMFLRASHRVYALALTTTTPSPLAPRDDDDTAAPFGAAAPLAAPDRMRIDLAGLGGRVVEFPAPSGRLTRVRGVPGGFVVTEQEEIPDEMGLGPVNLHHYDLASRTLTRVLSDVDDRFALSRDGGWVLYQRDGMAGIVETAREHAVGEGALAPQGLVAQVEPRAEWRQIYEEAVRTARDFFYDAELGGLRWDVLAARYRALVPHVAHRADLNYLIGELVGELSTSHTYVNGGDIVEPPGVDAGLLGVDWALDATTGLYRFQRIHRETDWNAPEAPPLAAPGLAVQVGDLLLAVNGRAVRAPMNVYEPFVGTVGQRTVLTVGRSVNDPAARQVTVIPVASETNLRYATWVRENRERVARATDGRVGYVHIATTDFKGMARFAKEWFPQVALEGVIVDDRYNRGGLIPWFMIETLGRTTWSYSTNRDGYPWHTPRSSFDGHRCLLINEYAGSGGDMVAHFFRQRGLGPLFGRTTGGSMAGLWRRTPFVDGDVVNIPDFAKYDDEGRWYAENEGVHPDVEVTNLPEDEALGRDPQLEHAIEWMREQLRTRPVKRPAQPPFRKL
ncbi:MAG: S41 family peptidase [bacterium]